jgi:hypothetical protein
VLPGPASGFDLVYTRSTKLYTVRNLNLREPQFVLANEGGRRVFRRRRSSRPSSGSTTGPQRLYTDFSNIFVNYNDGQAESTMLTAEVAQRVGTQTSVRGSYTFSRAFDNSSFTCCTSFAGFGSPRVGAFGPNEIGEPGDTDRAWGPSDFNRPHTFILSGQTRTCPSASA